MRPRSQFRARLQGRERQHNPLSSPAVLWLSCDSLDCPPLLRSGGSMGCNKGSWAAPMPGKLCPTTNSSLSGPLTFAGALGKFTGSYEEARQHPARKKGKGRLFKSQQLSRSSGWEGGCLPGPGRGGRSPCPSHFGVRRKLRPRSCFWLRQGCASCVHVVGGRGLRGSSPWASRGHPLPRGVPGPGCWLPQARGPPSTAARLPGGGSGAQAGGRRRRHPGR